MWDRDKKTDPGMGSGTAQFFNAILFRSDSINAIVLAPYKYVYIYNFANLSSWKT
jgi:hypothetical protein